jgi:hypothetical protein
MKRRFQKLSAWLTESVVRLSANTEKKIRPMRFLDWKEDKKNSICGHPFKKPSF